MKNHSKVFTGLAAVAITALMSTTSVFATEAKVPDTTHSTMETGEVHKLKTDKMHKIKTGKMQMSELSPMKGGYSILGTKFIGMEIENAQGEVVGEVKDIMLDSSGKVRYAAVSYGGFLGLGDKLFAVPMEAFKFMRESDMFYDDVKLILNISEEQLEDDKGFDNKNWPKLNDENYREELDKRYDVDRSNMNMNN